MLATFGCLYVFSGHIYNMAFVNFDYGWNMKVNIGVGAVNSLCWIAWTAWKWSEQRHVIKDTDVVVQKIPKRPK